VPVNTSGPYLNTITYTSVVGSYAEMTFVGSKFSLFYTKSSNRGKIDVIVDGVYNSTIDAYSPSLVWTSKWTSPTFSAGTHVVRFVYAGGGSYIDIDAIIITGAPVPAGNGLYDDTNSAWEYYGTWVKASTSGPYNGTITYTATIGSYAQFYFTGTKFTLYYTKNTNRGNIDVYIDGVYSTTLNANSALAWQSSYASSILSPGPHTAKFVFTGGNNFIDMDAIVISGAPVGAGLYDDTNSAWDYSGSWVSGSTAGPYNSTIKYTPTVGDSAQIAFTGTKFTLYYTKNTNRGNIDVYIDGVYSTTLNANAALSWQSSYTSASLSYGTHTAKFVHAGGGAYIDVDAIVISGSLVGAGLYDDTNAAWEYVGATWVSASTSGPYNGTIHYTATTGDYAQILFTGTKFTLYYTKNTNRGLIDVYIDGVYSTTLNANTALSWQSSYTSGALASGNHTAKFIHAGGGTYIDIDAIQIYP
jgi:hypothetical protein